MEFSRQEYWSGILVAMPFSRGPSWPTDWTQFSCIASRFFLSSEPPRKPYTEILQHPNSLCQLCLYRTHHYLKLSHVCYLPVFSICQSFAYLLTDTFPTHVSQTPLPKIMGVPVAPAGDWRRTQEPTFLPSSPRPPAVGHTLIGSSSTERAMLPARAEQPWLPGASHPLSLLVLSNPRV